MEKGYLCSYVKGSWCGKTCTLPVYQEPNARSGSATKSFKILNDLNSIVSVEYMGSSKRTFLFKTLFFRTFGYLEDR